MATEDLEKICTGVQTERKTSHSKNIAEAIKNYVVDTSASWMFYMPSLAASEYFIAKMEPLEVVKSRLFAMGVHALVMRPYGKVRQWWADRWNADEHSSKLKKFAVDTSASVLYQIPVYSAILYFSGVSLEEAAVALPSGLAIGTVSGRLYGYWLDKWRRVWKRKTTLD